LPQTGKLPSGIEFDEKPFTAETENELLLRKFAGENKAGIFSIEVRIGGN